MCPKRQPWQSLGTQPNVTAHVWIYCLKGARFIP